MTGASTILVTGGAGYIGSFTCMKILEAGYNVIVVDNLHNSSAISLERVELLCGKKPLFYNIDIRQAERLDEVFAKHRDIVGVVHFAALKSVAESTKKPWNYYDTNVAGTLVLLECMMRYNVRTLVFSSSATVYGDVTRFQDVSMIPIPETCPISPANTYGQTKAMIEQVVRDCFEAQNRFLKESGQGQGNEWNAALLRYFNPVGAHESGLMGEDPSSGEYNLLPVLLRIATGYIKELQVFGDDYDSRDGTMIRDFIHVEDVAEGHVAALSHLETARMGVRAWNLGSGRGTTVLEMRSIFAKATGVDIPYSIAGRRIGDVLNLTASPARAEAELDWKARRSIEDACRHAWKWAKNNPGGYSHPVSRQLLQDWKLGQSLQV